jgi:hypothetical protein
VTRLEPSGFSRRLWVASDDRCCIWRIARGDLASHKWMDSAATGVVDPFIVTVQV